VPHPASSAQKERDENGQPDKRPRSRREETTGTEGESGVPLSSAGETTRLPLFSSIFFLFGGYRRISRKNILDHDLRRTIYEMICKNPGIDSVTLATVTAINENTLRYHLWKLQEAGKITSFSRPSVVRYFQNQGAFDPREQVIWHYLWSGTPRHILALLYRTPGLSRQNLADGIGISGPSVTRQITQLTDDNLVENRSCGRTNTYYLTDEALAALSRAFSFRPPVSREAAAAHDIFSNYPEGQKKGQALIET
jgi:DNA-binding transcriptional ArsR family regulator